VSYNGITTTLTYKNSSGKFEFEVPSGEGDLTVVVTYEGNSNYSSSTITKTIPRPTSEIRQLVYSYSNSVHKVVFKKADGTEGKVTLDEGQIAKLTHFTAAGDRKSKEMLSQMLRDQKVPAEEINRIMGDANALRELGLIRETPKVGISRYSAVKQERTPGALEYFARPIKRTRDLQTRASSDLFKAADEHPKAAAR
jgi:hypothetical protein